MAYDTYWSVDLPGLSESGAALLLERATEFGVPEGGTAVDPQAWMTLHLDRATVETIAQGLRAIGGSAGHGLLGSLEEWLDAS